MSPIGGGCSSCALILSNTAGAVATACVQLATVRTWVGGRTARIWLQSAIAGQVAVSSAATFLWPSFVPALVNTVAGLTPVLFVEAVAARHRSGARAITSGFLLTALTGVIYSFNLTATSWLTPVDLAHLVMMASLALVYRGVLQRIRPFPLVNQPVPPDREPSARGRRDLSWLST